MKKLVYYDCFIGTYTEPGGSLGIYRARFAPVKRPVASLTGGTDFRRNPSFLVINQRATKLFTVGRLPNEDPGSVSMFEMTRHVEGHTIEPIASASTSGKGPCHLIYDEEKRRIVAANYASGSVGVIGASDNETTLDALQVIQHSGSSVDSERQKGPHAHSVTSDPTGTRVVVCDLGLDEIIVYAWDTKRLLLIEEPVCRAKIEPGSGPRHFAFHPNQRFGFVANELGNTVTSLSFDTATGALEPLRSVGTLPKRFSRKNTVADIHLNSAGTRLYVSNRGHDSVAVFDVNPETGDIERLGHIKTRGHTPRNFALTPDDQYLFVANKDSDSITIFDLTKNAVPSRPIVRIEVPSPSCIQFVQIP